MRAKSKNFWTGARDRLRALKNIPPVLRIVWQSGPGVVSGGLACRLLASLIPIAMLTVSKAIIDAVVESGRGQSLPYNFWWLVGAEFGLAAAGTVLGRAIGLCDALLADRFTRHVSVRVMEHAAKLDLTSYEDPVFYDKLERARVQATDRIAMVQAMGSMLQQAIMAATFSVTLFLFSPWLLLLLTACVVPAFLGESHFAFLGYSLNFGQTPVRRQIDYLRTLGASKESAKELKLFGLAPFLTGEYGRLSNQIYDQNVKLARKRFWAGSLLSLLSTSGYYGAYAYVVYRAVTGDLSVGTLTLLAGSIAGASSNISAIFATSSSIADQALFLTDLLEFFAVRPKIVSPSAPIPAPRPIRDGFVFENVSFSYPGSERRVLDRLDLHIHPGERIALIGENGQGKTTIVKLLTRLYDPADGRILLDGIDLREYDVEGIQREIGVIFQDFMRYELSARQNIGVGRIEASHDHEAIRHAARKSLADSVIARLPEGYEQMLGRRFEGGVDLSGGEWQKVALARAYLRDAQLLILDEPTAALDARSEFEVFQRFSELTKEKTSLLISHRFSTVRMADRIIVLENGRIAEEGDHSRLLALGGRYAEMFEMQAASYR